MEITPQGQAVPELGTQSWSVKMVASRTPGSSIHSCAQYILIHAIIDTHTHEHSQTRLVGC